LLECRQAKRPPRRALIPVKYYALNDVIEYGYGKEHLIIYGSSSGCRLPSKVKIFCGTFRKGLPNHF
jgi:hypothetical protein